VFVGSLAPNQGKLKFLGDLPPALQTWSQPAMDFDMESTEIKRAICTLSGFRFGAKECHFHYLRSRQSSTLSL
jgi:hypothetical protein